MTNDIRQQNGRGYHRPFCMFVPANAYTFGMNQDLRRAKPWKIYAVSIALPLLVGGLSALISLDGMRAYEQLNQPPLSPPMWLFPVVWTILYTLMGVSSGMVFQSRLPARRDALRIYGLQLALNFCWPILFFALGLRLTAFVWLLILEALIVIMIALFTAIRPIAGCLQIPYAVWCAFAAYLNLSAFLLNQ